MIRLRTALRTMPAFWLAIPICILAGGYATLVVPPDGYAVGATAKATATLPFVGAFCAGCAAWEGSRLRRARLWNAPSVRSRVAIAFWSLLPVVLVGLFAVVIAIAVALIQSGAGLLPDPRFIAMTALDLVAYSAAGFAAGLLLPFAVAGPLAIVATLIWLAFVPAVYPVWLRHLTGMFRDCCGLARDLSPRAVLASSIVNLGIIAAAALLMAGPALVVRRSAGALATLAVAGLAGVLLVSGMTYSPTVPRDPALLDCRAADGVTVCTWPEHQARAAEVSDIVAGVHAGWQGVGIDAPPIFTEADPTVAPAGAVVLRLSGVLSTEDAIIGAVAAGMLPPRPDCATGSTGGIAFRYLQAWYVAAGGMSPDGLRTRYADARFPQYPETLTVVEQLWAATPEARRDWISRAEEVSQACDEWALDLLTVNP